MLNYTNCDAVMIGRAAIGNPWIFIARQERDQLPFHEISHAIHHPHLQEMLAYHDNP